jgi:hypothetical protein
MVGTKYIAQMKMMEEDLSSLDLFLWGRIPVCMFKLKEEKTSQALKFEGIESSLFAVMHW